MAINKHCKSFFYFQVKQLVTSHRVVVVIVFIFVLLTSSVTPVYLVNKLGLVVSPTRNKSVIGLIHTSDRENVQVPSYVINNVLIPFSAFIIIIICTVTLVVNLRQKTKWRKMSTSQELAQTTSNRDRKVTKMVVIISSLFIVCFVPVCISFIAMSLECEFSVGGRYQNIHIVIMGVGFLLESVNSAGNIFIYYHMSSRYNAIFWQIFCSKNSLIK